MRLVYVGMVEVAYHNAQLHAVVMHRIVALDGDRYVFKGDNNDFRDQYHARRSDLVGQEWLYLPGAGRYLQWLRSPLFFGGLVFAITLLGYASPGSLAVGGEHDGVISSDSQLASARVRTDEPAVSRVETITALAVVAIVALALVAIAWSMPTSRSDEKSAPYRQSGSFGYHAAADSAGTYGDEGVRTGDPILVPLVGPVTATFDYRLDAAGAKRVHGTSQMVATVQTAGGLSRDFPVATSARFSGSRTTITGQLPLRAILAFVGQAQHDAGATDTSPSTLTLTPQVTVHGTAHGQRFGDHFGLQLTFDVDGSNLRRRRPTGRRTSSPSSHPRPQARPPTGSW